MWIIYTGNRVLYIELRKYVVIAQRNSKPNSGSWFEQGIGYVKFGRKQCRPIYPKVLVLKGFCVKKCSFVSFFKR